MGTSFFLFVSFSFWFNATVLDPSGLNDWFTSVVSARVRLMLSCRVPVFFFRCLIFP
jgi:hypothetical protein